MLNRPTQQMLKRGNVSAGGLVPLTIVKRRPPSASDVFDTYWQFAAERQEIMLRRYRRQPSPWTADPILATYKFTNTYRAADRVSQYLIRNVIYGDSYHEQDTVFRTILFKLFNKIETWQLLENSLGKLQICSFDADTFDCILNDALTNGTAIYSSAYIIPSSPVGTMQRRKHRTHLELLSHIIRGQIPAKLLAARSMARVYELLRALPGIGPFLAYQFTIDLNYSGYIDFSEMDFVVPGPGARDGIKKCFVDLGDYSETDVIRWVTENQEEEFSARGLRFSSLGGRPLQLVDCQNLFCEVDKYARIAHPDVKGHTDRKRIKHKFSPSRLPIGLWFPPKWGINDNVKLSNHVTSGACLE